MIARTAGGLGIVALLLAVSGLYSVIAFFVALRTSEFGIRVALGVRVDSHRQATRDSGKANSRVIELLSAGKKLGLK